MYSRSKNKRIILPPVLALFIISAVSIWMKFSLKPASGEYHGIRALQFAQPSSVRFRGVNRPSQLENKIDEEVAESINSSK